MLGQRGSLAAPCPLCGTDIMGDQAVRSNSGKGESRNNLHDPTLREHPHMRITRALAKKGKTTGLGSASRKRRDRGANG